MKSSPDSSPVPERVIKPKVGLSQKIFRSSLVALNLLAGGDRVISSNPQALETPNRSSAVMEIPTPYSQNADRLVMDQGESIQEKVQENIFELKDVLGIPGAAKVYSEEPEKVDYGSFMVLDEGIIFVKKGMETPNIKQHDKAIKVIEEALRIIRKVDPLLLKKFAQEFGVAAIAANLNTPEYKDIFDKHPSFFATYLLLKGKTATKDDPKTNKGIVLLNKDQVNVATAIAYIITESYGINALRNITAVTEGNKTVFLLPDGFVSRDRGMYKTWSLRDWLLAHKLQIDKDLYEDVWNIVNGEERFYLTHPDRSSTKFDQLINANN